MRLTRLVMLAAAAAAAATAAAGPALGREAAAEPGEGTFAAGVAWLERLVTAEGVGLAPGSPAAPAARRAPSESFARANLRARLWAEVESLQVEGRGPAGRASVLLARLPALREQLVPIVDGHRLQAVRFFTDGGVSLRGSIGLDDVAAPLLRAAAGAEAPPPGACRPAVDPGTGPTGLVVDARALGWPPRLRIRMRAQDGQVAYDSAVVAGSLCQGWGPVALASDLGVAGRQARLGPRPLQVTAVAVDGDDTLVLANIAAAALMALVPQLQQGRLVVVCEAFP